MCLFVPCVFHTVVICLLVIKGSLSVSLSNLVIPVSVCNEGDHRNSPPDGLNATLSQVCVVFVQLDKDLHHSE